MSYALSAAIGTGAALLLSACGAPSVSPQTLPSIPAIAAEQFPAAVQPELAQALEAARAAPEDPEANGRLGMWLHSRRQFQAAADCYRRAEVFAPADFRWPYLWGVAQAELGEPDAAIESFRRALARKPYAPAAIRLGEALQAAGRLEESQQAYEQALRLDREAPAAYYGLGRVMAAQGHTSEAVGLLERARDLSPSSGAARYALALAYRDAGDPEASQREIAAAEQFARLLPRVDDPLLRQIEALAADAHYYLNEGQRLESAGNLPQALDAYRKALELDPEMAPAHANLVGVYGQMQQFRQAEQHYRKALELDPNMEELHNNWGVIELLRGRPAGAEQSFRRALQINPNSAGAHVNLGAVLYESGRRRQGREHLEKALQSDPNQASAHFYLGRDLIGSGKIEEGIAHLEKSVAGPRDARTAGHLYALAEAHLRAGRRDAAIQYARQALRLAEAAGQRQMAAAIAEDLSRIEGPAAPVERDRRP